MDWLEAAEPDCTRMLGLIKDEVADLAVIFSECVYEVSSELCVYSVVPSFLRRLR